MWGPICTQTGTVYGYDCVKMIVECCTRCGGRASGSSCGCWRGFGVAISKVEGRWGQKKIIFFAGRKLAQDGFW